jgi:hypothetical protein
MSDTVPGMTVPPPATRAAALAAALAALDGLAGLGETIEDEWTYVTALAEAGRTRLNTAAGLDPTVPLAPDRAAAVAAACTETARIADPHRAIDWLSTFPAVVELALATPDAAAGPRPGAPAPRPDAAAGPRPDAAAPRPDAAAGPRPDPPAPRPDAPAHGPGAGAPDPASS